MTSGPEGAGARTRSVPRITRRSGPRPRYTWRTIERRACAVAAAQESFGSSPSGPTQGAHPMAELIALWIVCKNIGAIARSRGVRAQPFQVKAVVLWFVFEFACAFVAIALGMQGIPLYLAA